MLLPISQLRIDGGTQSRAGLDGGWAQELAALLNDGAELPPVIAFYDGAAYWLADGFHRVSAYTFAGRDRIPVDVRQGTQDDAVWFGAGANLLDDAGRPRAKPATASDRSRAAEALARRFPLKTVREIAAQAGVSHTTVERIRSRLAQSAKSAPPAETKPARGAERKREERAAAVNDPEPKDEEDPPDQDDDPPVDDASEGDPDEEPGEVPEPVSAPPRSTGMSDLDVTLACVRGLNIDDRAELFRRIGVIPCAALVSIIEQRGRDPEYAQMRRISEPPPNATRGMRLVTAVLDGADVALAMLGCTWASTADDIRRAYREASLSAHPDRGGNQEVMARLNWARGVVRDFVESKR